MKFRFVGIEILFFEGDCEAPVASAPPSVSTIPEPVQGVPMTELKTNRPQNPHNLYDKTFLLRSHRQFDSILNQIHKNVLSQVRSAVP